MYHLEDKIISCKGNDEEALKIMQILKSASSCGTSIDDSTSSTIHQNFKSVNKIGAEQINSELCQLLCGKSALQVLLDYSDVISEIIPELKPCVGFDQNNRFHQYTVYDHIAHAVSNYSGKDISIKMALLLHDIGKPSCYTEDENGGHFYGHSIPSRDLADKALTRLQFNDKTKSEILDLVLYHDSPIEPTEKTVKRWLNKIGEERFRQLLEVKIADILAHAEGTQESRIIKHNRLLELVSEIVAEQQRFSIKDLAVRGDDILKLGVKEGKVIGDILTMLFNKVINNEIENEYLAQVSAAKNYLLELGVILEG